MSITPRLGQAFRPNRLELDSSGSGRPRGGYLVRSTSALTRSFAFRVTSLPWV